MQHSHACDRPFALSTSESSTPATRRSISQTRIPKNLVRDIRIIHALRESRAPAILGRRRGGGGALPVGYVRPLGVLRSRQPPQSHSEQRASGESEFARSLLHSLSTNALLQHYLIASCARGDIRKRPTDTLCAHPR